VASLSQGRTAAAQCGLFTYKSVPVIFEPPCTLNSLLVKGMDININSRITGLKWKHYVKMYGSVLEKREWIV